VRRIEAVGARSQPAPSTCRPRAWPHARDPRDAHDPRPVCCHPRGSPKDLPLHGAGDQGTVMGPDAVVRTAGPEQLACQSATDAAWRPRQAGSPVSASLVANPAPTATVVKTPRSVVG
jgi:hypothetical protein